MLKQRWRPFKQLSHAAAAPHSGPECNQSAPKVIYPTFEFWYFFLQVNTLVYNVYMHPFPLKLIINMEIFISKFKFDSTFYQK